MSELTYASGQVTRLAEFLRSLYREVRDSNVPFMAGSIAYSAFVSLFPLLLLGVIAASAIGGEAFARYVVGLVEGYLTPSGQEALIESLTRANRRAQVSVFTLVVFLWATLRVFRGLDIAFSILYGTGGKYSLLDQVKDGLIVFTALAVAIAGMVSLLVFTPGFSNVLPFPFLGALLLVVFLTVVFLPMYYVFPDVDVTVGEILPGAVVAAVGWAILQQGFQIYVSLSDKVELYGILGAVLLLITWLYVGALIILLGGAVNVVGRETGILARSQKHQLGDD